jgi:DNA-binding response OmpR family regulator
MTTIKVLVVEDELLIARDLSQNLKRQGFQVNRIVSSAQAALRGRLKSRKDSKKAHTV